MQRWGIRLAAAVLLVGVGTVEGAITIGGFDVARGGPLSMEAGTDLNGIRSAILAGYPGTVITGANVLTSEYLSTIDVLFIASPWNAFNAIEKLTPAEQSAVLSFVEAGGGALIFADNDSYDNGALPDSIDGGVSEEVNESLIDPFGLDVTETINGIQAVTVSDPPSHLVTNGPFGQVSSFSTGWPGWFDNLGPYAQSLATLNSNNGTALAVIGHGALAPTSGGVVLFSDVNFVANKAAYGSVYGSKSETLVLNALHFASVPEPSTFLVWSLLATLGITVGRRPRHKVCHL